MSGARVLAGTAVVSALLVAAIHEWQHFESTQGHAGLQRDKALRRQRESAHALQPSQSDDHR